MKYGLTDPGWRWDSDDEVYYRKLRIGNFELTLEVDPYDRDDSFQPAVEGLHVSCAWNTLETAKEEAEKAGLEMLKAMITRLERQ